MRYKVWTLAVSDAREPEIPYAAIHASVDDALRAIIDAYDLRLPPGEPMTQSSVEDALDERAGFTIEPAIIDTDQLEGEK